MGFGDSLSTWLGRFGPGVTLAAFNVSGGVAAFGTKDASYTIGSTSYKYGGIGVSASGGRDTETDFVSPTKAEHLEATFDTPLSKVTIGLGSFFGGPGALFDTPYTEQVVWTAYNAPAGVQIGQGTVLGTANGLAEFTIEIAGQTIKKISLTPGEDSPNVNAGANESDFVLRFIDGGGADSAKEVFTYKGEDIDGEQSSTTLTVTVKDHNATVNHAPAAVADDGTTNAAFRMTEDDGFKTFDVRANDTLDPDAGAANTVTVGAISVGANALGIDTSDLSVSVNGSNQVQVQLTSSDWQKLAAGQTLDVTVPYTLHGDQAGDVSTANLTVRVTGANDAPVLAGSLSAMVAEGGTYTLIASDLDFTDPDDNAAGVTFTISAQNNGIVKVNGNAQTTFTGTELAAGQVTFTHDGSETTAAFFQVSVEDGNEDGSPATASTFNFTVTPVNDAPLGTNNTVTTNEDTACPFSAADFGFSDSDGNALAAIKISSLPAAGSLLYSGVAITAAQVAAGYEVSASDLALGKLTFAPAPDAEWHRLRRLHLPGKGQWRHRQWRHRYQPDPQHHHHQRHAGQ